LLGDFVAKHMHMKNISMTYDHSWRWCKRCRSNHPRLSTLREQIAIGS